VLGSHVVQVFVATDKSVSTGVKLSNFTITTADNLAVVCAPQAMCTFLVVRIPIALEFVAVRWALVLFCVVVIQVDLRWC
jgi:hypothetical protein